jgi:hypothetical protein
MQAARCRFAIDIPSREYRNCEYHVMIGQQDCATDPSLFCSAARNGRAEQKVDATLMHN